MLTKKTNKKRKPPTKLIKQPENQNCTFSWMCLLLMLTAFTWNFFSLLSWTQQQKYFWLILIIGCLVTKKGLIKFKYASAINSFNDIYTIRVYSLALGPVLPTANNYMLTYYASIRSLLWVKLKYVFRDAKCFSFIWGETQTKSEKIHWDIKTQRTQLICLDMFSRGIHPCPWQPMAHTAANHGAGPAGPTSSPPPPPRATMHLPAGPRALAEGGCGQSPPPTLSAQAHLLHCPHTANPLATPAPLQDPHIDETVQTLLTEKKHVIPPLNKHIPLPCTHNAPPPPSPPKIKKSVS